MTTCQEQRGWDSLAFALEVVAENAGIAIDHDDLCALMGLPWLGCAVPHGEDMSRWSMHARDAFLIEAGRLFGMQIREIHPPRAARGLDRAAEFDQHFDASYRPLILRALEHHQPVLAWQGWQGDRSLSWGLIHEKCADGVGFRGATYWSASERACDAIVPLVRPPTQVYIVERITPSVAQGESILDASLEHARAAFRNELADRCGLVTGTAAWNEWIARFQNGKADDGSEQCAASIRASLECGLRFLARYHGRAPAHGAHAVETLERESQQMLRALEGFCRPTPSPRTRDERLDQLRRARDAAARAGEALARRSGPRP